VLASVTSIDTIIIKLLSHSLTLIIQLLLKPDAQRQAATKGLAVVSDLMLEYRVIEKTFQSRSRQLQTRANPAERDLITNSQSKIVGLYNQILEFQIRMTYYYSRHGLNRYMRDLVTSDDWQGIQTTIDASHKAIREKLDIIGILHLDNALEAQKSQFQHFSEQSMPILKSLHSAVTRIENFVNDADKIKGNYFLPSKFETGS
jgi:N-terminal domain of NWD NACHT-NTPase